MKAAKALEEAMRREDKPIPPDWFTAEQYAEARSICISHACHTLQDGVKAGVLDTQKWKRRDRWVNLFRVRHCKPKIAIKKS